MLARTRWVKHLGRNWNAKAVAAGRDFKHRFDWFQKWSLNQVSTYGYRLSDCEAIQPAATLCAFTPLLSWFESLDSIGAMLKLLQSRC
jgi:hypothetical protein